MYFFSLGVLFLDDFLIKNIRKAELILANF
jgi:hypothetical protein